jgi:hypothetical protein
MMMTITLHPWEIKIDLGIIKAKIILVLTRVEHSAQGRIHVILGFITIYVENQGQLRLKYLVSKERMIQRHV